MKWNHLPQAGGLYDQNPDLLERFAFIFNERNAEEAKQRAKQQAEQRQRANRR